MTRLPAILALGICLLACGWEARAQQAEYDITALGNGFVEYSWVTGNFYGTNGVMVLYEGAVLTADNVSGNNTTGDIDADGHVRVQWNDQVWVSEHLRCNFLKRRIEAVQFRTGHPPVYAEGQGLHAEPTNNVYTATNAWVTTEDIYNPLVKVRAKYLRIIPGEKVEARDATLYVGDVPLFYFPYYSRRLGPRANHFNFVPGYRTTYGPYLLSEYDWFMGKELDGVAHVDYRQRRGVGLGPDTNFHLDRWGEGSLRYYYMKDENPSLDAPGAQIPEDRQRVYFAYQANPWTNVSVKSMVRFQTDTNIVKEFFESEYTQDPQPSTFVEVNKFWQNFSVDSYVQPRLNNFLETVERLPEVRLTGFRQELGATPFYYESQSSMGYYRRLFAETNSMPTGMDYEAARADSFHQILLPYALFGWLNLTPRAGARVTYYGESSGPGARTDELTRGVFNTGAELTFKASRLWPAVEEGALDIDGLRHIIQPSLNYVYIPSPNYRPDQLPQFDYQLPSLAMLPIDFPQYNSIDSIDSQNVLRLGLNNKLQTKRLGQVVDLLNWDLYTDWRLQPRSDLSTFSDVFSDLVFKPRRWLTLESLTRYDVQDDLWRMSFTTLTFQPNETWSWSIGHFYLHDDLPDFPTGLGIGNDLITSTMFYRVNENWCLRAAQRYEARDGRLQEQDYSIYRDLRSWTAALTFRVLDSTIGPKDYTVAFTFSLKAMPKFGVNQDVARPWFLLGD